MSDDKPSNWDWVTARHRCSLVIVFKQLEMEARNAVEKRNELRNPDRDLFAFHIEPQADRFMVLRAMNVKAASVLFLLKANHISVEDPPGHELFKATLTLNDSGECRLRVNGDELDRWQVLRKALEGLLFDIP